MGALLQQPEPTAAQARIDAIVGAYTAGRLGDAVALGRALLAEQPSFAAMHNLVGAALLSLRDTPAAAASFRDAIASAPEFAEAHNNLGTALKAQGDLDGAIAAFDRAIALQPDYHLAFNNLGNAFFDKEDVEVAVQCYIRAIKLKDDFGDAYHNLGMALKVIGGRDDEAIWCFERALAARATARTLAAKIQQKLHVCDWSAFAELGALDRLGGEEAEAPDPFFLLPLEDDPARQLARSRAWGRRFAKGGGIAPRNGPADGAKIRVGYFSADFCNHATMHLLSGVMREHDRERFEIHVFAYGGARDDRVNLQLTAAGNRLHDVRGVSNHDIVRLARGSGIDIAVDLKGYTQGARTELFAARVAPVQVDFLGYPGSMGVDFVDYLLADAVVVPDAERGQYDERIIRLAGGYQPNDNQRPIGDCAGTRADFGLPADGFVFCCFNQNYKIGPREFAVWMRLLGAVEGSVLWLLRSNRWAEDNLRREAAARGIAADRLVFTDKIGHAAHLARHRHADLFLDTFAVNAHTTASDALWAGLPVLTLAGRQFAARVCASLLEGVGLPVLVTATEAEYEARALEIARCPERLHALREALAANRATHPLFDTAGYTRRLEAAYAAIHQRGLAGLPPGDLHIDRDGAATFA